MNIQIKKYCLHFFYQGSFVCLLYFVFNLILKIDIFENRKSENHKIRTRPLKIANCFLFLYCRHALQYTLFLKRLFLGNFVREGHFELKKYVLESFFEILFRYFRISQKTVFKKNKHKRASKFLKTWKSYFEGFPNILTNKK